MRVAGAVAQTATFSNHLSLRGSQSGSVLIIVLWVAFGLVSLALYFGNAMSMEMRASDNRLAGLEAEHALAGGARYVSYILANNEEPGRMPDLTTYASDAVRVGESHFWLIGRAEQAGTYTDPYFSLVDECSKLNLNTASQAMLEALPRMTPELAAAIKDWRDTDSDVTEGGAESDVYLRLKPAYNCKNAPFETVDELRLVNGATLEILYGEDTNLNGILDLNENDADASPPFDNRDGRLDPGLLEYVTVYSRQPNTRTNGSPRINITTANPQGLQELLQEKFNSDRANQIMAKVRGGGGGGGGAQVASVLEFYMKSGMTADEFSQIETEVTASTGPYAEGLVNVNTASEAVLACIPGIGTDKAASVVAYRQANAGQLTSMAWIVEALGQEGATQAGRYITGQSYQFSADIAALGHYGRGYRRTRFVFDTSEGTPKIISRQDLGHMGWALGTQVRQQQLLARNTH